MTVTRRRGRRTLLLLLAAVAVLSAGACSGPEGGDRTGDAAGPAQDDAVAEQAAGDDGDAPDTGAGAGVDLDAAAAAASRELISTAQLTVQVEDLDVAGDEAVQVAVEADGFVSGEQTDREQATSTLTVEVPPTAFRRTLDALGELGDVRAQEITTDDVTEQVVDLESRITTAEASVARLRDLTEAATSVDELRSLEQELLARETTLEELRGQLRTVEDQVSLSTITVTFTTEDGTPIVDEPDEDHDLPTFLGGLEAGVDVLVAVVSVALAVLGFLTPFLVPAAVAGLVVLLVVRRRSRRQGGTDDAGADGPQDPAPTGEPAAAEPELVG